MNRAEYRRLMKAGGAAKKNAAHIPTNYEQAYEKGYSAGVQYAAFFLSGVSLRASTTALIMSLRSELGFGKTRIHRFLKNYEASMEDLTDKEHAERVREWIRSDIGLDPDDYSGARAIDISKELRIERGGATEEELMELKEKLVNLDQRMTKVR